LRPSIDFDSENEQFWKDGQKLSLPGKRHQFLHLLYQHREVPAKTVVSLLGAKWKEPKRSLRNLWHRLRKDLGDDDFKNPRYVNKLGNQYLLIASKHGTWEESDEEFFGQHEGVTLMPKNVRFWRFRPPGDLIHSSEVVDLEPPDGTVYLAAPLRHKKRDIDSFIDQIVAVYGDKTPQAYWDLLYREFPRAGDDDLEGPKPRAAKRVQAIEWLRAHRDSGLDEARMHSIKSLLLTNTCMDAHATIVADWNSREGLVDKDKYSVVRWNGRNLMLVSLQKQISDQSIYHCKFSDSDYHSYFCIARCSDAIRTGFRLPQQLGEGENGLQKYLARPQLIHGGFGVAVMVVTSDRRLVIRKRSEGAADFGEANKWYMSANEGLRANEDILTDRSGARVIKPCIEIVKRAIRKELVGEGFPIDERLASCYLTGVLLYLPNLSVNLCFLVGLNASFEDLVALEKEAEHAEREFHPLEDASFVQYTRRSMCDFVAGTRVPAKHTLNPYAQQWDEGSLVAMRLAFPPEKFRLF
jgi:hypothetical protein